MDRVPPMTKGEVGGSNPLEGTQAMAMVHFGSLPLFALAINTLQM